MYQNKKHFSEWSNLYRPLCSVAVLCTSLLVVPDVAFATGIQTTSIITQQQQIVVKGKVVDASGETIIGATILQVGSQSHRQCPLNTDSNSYSWKASFEFYIGIWI